MVKLLAVAFGVILWVLLGVRAVSAQTGPSQSQSAGLPSYIPPPRGAPGGRVGGASRGTYQPAFPLPTIEALAPQDQSGLSASATPNLYYYVSGPVYWPTQFAISAPMQPAPVVEVYLTSPRAAGVYAIHVSDFGVRLKPGIVYTWSVAAILDPNARSRDIVAGATLLISPPDPGLENIARTAASSRRAVLWAQAGFWYDAVAAAAEAAPYDGYAALDALMKQVGLVEPGYARRSVGALSSSLSTR
jgi:Domain of Unknown Function (DUF928)